MPPSPRDLGIRPNNLIPYWREQPILDLMLGLHLHSASLEPRFFKDLVTSGSLGYFIEVRPFGLFRCPAIVKYLQTQHGLGVISNGHFGKPF